MTFRYKYVSHYLLCFFVFLCPLNIDTVTAITVIDPDACLKEVKITSGTNADFVIAGFFPIHGHTKTKDMRYNHNGIIWSEAFKYYINEVNNNCKLLQNITLGYSIIDTCSKQYLALPAALSIISNAKCRNDYENMPICGCDEHIEHPYIGIIGDASSSISTVVSNVVGIISMPQISYASTSLVLSDKVKHPSFLRTIPPDKFQVKLILDVIQYFNWSYVSVVWSDDDYGRIALYNLIPLLKSNDLCLAVEGGFSRYNTMKINEIIDEIKEADQSNVVILWAQKPDADTFLSNAKIKALHNKIWLGTEAWAHRDFVLSYPSEMVHGLLAIKPYSGFDEKFKDHFANVAIGTPSSNIWIEHYFSLRNKQEKTNISSFENITGEFSFSNIGFVRDAVYTMAKALEDYLDKDSLKSSFNYEQYLRLVRHVELSIQVNTENNHIKYDVNGDIDFARYNLLIVQKNNEGKLYFRGFGTWSSGKSGITVKEQDVNWPISGKKLPQSRCGKLCAPGFYAVNSSKSCCWHCIKCETGSYKNDKGNHACLKCPFGTLSNHNKTLCYRMTLKFVKCNSFYAIVLYIISFSGMIVSICFIAIYSFNYNTPVVKSSNYMMSFLQLATQIALFVSPLLLSGEPNEILCMLRSWFPGFLLALIVNIIFTKTEFVMSVFRARYVLTANKVLYSKIFEAMAILLICLFQISITIGVNVIKPTEPISSVFKNQIMTECNNFDIHLLIQISFIIMLALACLIQAYRSKDLPSKYNDAIHVTYAMLNLLLCLFLILLLYLSLSDPSQQLFVIGLLINISNFSLLYWSYGYKIYAILFTKEKNTTEEFQTDLFTHAYDNMKMNNNRRLAIAPVVRHHSVDYTLPSSFHDIVLPRIKRTISQRPRSKTDLSLGDRLW